MKTKILISAILILPIIGVIFAIETFQRSSEQIQTAFRNEAGKVASAEGINVKDIAKEFPIFPSSEIVNIDTTSENTSLTLESSKPINEIKSFYNDYFRTNGWQPIDGKYTKADKKLKVEISENVIKLTLDK